MKLFSNLAFFCLFSLPLIVDAQKVHAPAELLKIMTDSKLQYSLGELDKDVEPRDYSSNLNYNLTYHEDSEGHIVIRKIELSADAKAEFDLAEDAFGKTAKYAEARKHYQKVIDIQPNFYPAYTYMAQTYESEENYDKAIDAYKRAISKNFVDYMPHWFMADCYFKLKNYEDAADEITIASILNRNHPKIADAMKKIYEKAHLKYDDWVLTPQIEVKLDEDDKISVKGKNEWLGYAIAKAIWKYETGYAEGQGQKQGGQSILQEKECLICLITVAENKKKKIKDKAVVNLQKAIDNKFLEEYILYEEFLRWQPSVVYQLSNITIKEMKDYVLLTHGGKKVKK